MITFRVATVEDAEAILGIYRPYVEQTPISFEVEAPTLADFRTRIEGIVKAYPYLVAEEDGRLAGFCYAAPAFERAAFGWDADISVYLHEDYHRRGIGEALYHAVHELLRLQGYYTVYALITGGNAGSIAFHTAMGYREVGRLPNTGFKLGAWQDLVWMEKILKEREGVPNPIVPFPKLDVNAVEAVLSRAAQGSKCGC